MNTVPYSVGDRGLRLLFVLALGFPNHFMSGSIINELIGLLSVKGDNVVPLTLAILKLVGKFIFLLTKN